MDDDRGALPDIAEDVIGLSSDSRTVQPGSLYLACAGEQQHGLDYIEDAVSAGAVAVAWEPDKRYPNGPGSITRQLPTVAVSNLQHKVGVIADRFYGHPSQQMNVIGITGTNGKTSCSHYLAQVLSADHDQCGVIGTLGYGIYGRLQTASHTTPDAITLQSQLAQMLQASVQHVVMEVSSHGLDQGRVNGMNFTMAVLTNLSRDHLDYHTNESAYAAAKQILFDWPGLSWRILNLDDAFGRALLSKQDVPCLGYGFGADISKATEFFVSGSALRTSADGLAFHIDTHMGQAEISSKLLGRFNASNLLAVIAVLLSLGYTLEVLVKRLANVQAVAGRMERFSAAGKPLLVVDYAHTPDALRVALEAAREHITGKLWCVFGCGGDRDRGKRSMMAAVAEQLADHVTLTDDNPRNEDAELIIKDIQSGLVRPEQVRVIHDRASAIKAVFEQASVDDLILVAGKGHEDYQLIGNQRLPYSDRETVVKLLGGKC
ncbi:MAG TPA: UDP-N-acetylmuramoyl-L-alanyl-D-glutamate--2,6-diaminopimelate ligase [Gammaproteobacteria bacterium]|nr:UDP-N-acetylmuramoyl-L-alanyl-D-glutamate--2,6-diaminopimelate ligase [Gammaproteobacteria bacterium]